MSAPHTRRVVSEINITTWGDHVAQTIQTTKVTTANGRSIECTWHQDAFKAAYVQGHIDLDELEAHPRLGKDDA